jgi:hypothetical protein
MILKKPAGPTWIRKLGVAGFFFFLLKGLAWLVVPVLLAMKGCPQ